MASDLDDFLDSDPVFSRVLENALSHLGEKERHHKLESRALDKLRGMLRSPGT